MTTADKPGDPADKAADGAFGGVTTHSHRAGYGDDKLARLVAWLRAHPTTTLASGEGALLLAEIDRLRDDLHTQDGWVQWAKGEINALRRANKDSLDHYADARAEIDRLREERDEEIARVVRITERLGTETLRADRAERILAALREPSANVIESANVAFPFAAPMVRAAVAAAEQEVGRE